ncbi:menaquinone biosynthesis decarboxylase [Persephonella sp.]
MAYKDLREFIKDLEKEGELLRVKDKVSPILEITEIADNVMKLPDGGKALLFENVEGHEGIPVLINAFGSEKRMKMALGVDKFEDIGWKLYRILKPEVPNTFLDKLKRIPELKKLNDALPKVVKSGKVKEIIKKGEDINLFEFPVLKCWPKDGGRFITLPQVVSKDPETGLRNIGMYRIQILDKDKVAVHWQIHKGGAKHYWKYKELGQKIPVAIVIGGDPVLTYVASAPLPEDVDEYLFAGIIREKGVELVKCETVDLEVPADAEIVIEGFVDPEEPLVDEGPFGDHTGFYTPVEKYPMMHVTAVTYRKNPVYLTTIVGRPPMEDGWMGKATERIFLPLIKFNLPEVVDYNLPVSGCFHNFCFVSIKKRYPGHAYKVMDALWGMGQMMFTKNIVVFDEWVDVQNIDEVLWIWGNNVDPARDVVIKKGVIDVLDHSTDLVGFGGKMGIDATTKWKEEGYQRQWPDLAVMDESIKEKVKPVVDKVMKQIMKNLIDKEVKKVKKLLK